MQVTGLDTGSGEVVFEEPITVGWVVQDREGVVCDDTCEFAFDGVCDDGTEGEYDQYYEYYGYYQDDDLGGYYGGEDGTEGEKEAAGGSYADVCTSVFLPAISKKRIRQFLSSFAPLFYRLQTYIQPDPLLSLNICL